MTTATELKIRLRRPHPTQVAFVDCDRKRIVARCGRRWGKTTGVAIRHVKRFLAGRRQLYMAPTQEQTERFWFEICRALQEPIDAGIFKKNESSRYIELVGTEQRIKAKTAWNPDTARGDYGDDITLDEFQMMDEKVWTKVVAPMMLDNDGTTTFIYTPPDAESAAKSKARDPMFAAHTYEKAEKDETGRWACFHFTSHDNPHLSSTALEEITLDMDDRSYRQEIMAEDIWETPGALWTQGMVDAWRITEDEAPPWEIIVVALDPSKSGKPGSDACGIVVCGQDGLGVAYALENLTEVQSPDKWGAVGVDAVERWRGLCNHIEIVAESNAGGEMIVTTINPIAEGWPGGAIKEAIMDKDRSLIPSVANKYVRALPIRSRWGRGECGIVGHLPKLEYQMCNWIDGAAWSPNAMDAMVVGMRYLLLTPKTAAGWTALEWGDT